MSAQNARQREELRRYLDSDALNRAIRTSQRRQDRLLAVIVGGLLLGIAAAVAIVWGG